MPPPGTYAKTSAYAGRQKYGARLIIGWIASAPPKVTSCAGIVLWKNKVGVVPIKVLVDDRRQSLELESAQRALGTPPFRWNPGG